MKKLSFIIIRILLLIAFPAMLFYACTVIYVYERMDGNAVFPVDCAIVFGTAVWPVFDRYGLVIASVPGPGIARRVSTAAHLLEEGSVRHLYLSGGKGEGNRQSEAEVMGEYAQSLGVPKSSITVEDRSRSTWENLQNTRPLTSRCDSVVAISDSYHLARIGLYAQVQGWPQVQTYPADRKPDLLFRAQNLLREAVGIDLLVLTRLLT